jgi:hypothetical protein
MADLLDIAPSTACEAVWIDGHRISVRGLSLDAIASIVARFPELKTLVNGGLGDDFLPRIIQACGAAVGPIIAAGCGHLADEAYEARGAVLLPEHQLKFLKAIFGLTLPNGITSFTELLTSVIVGITDEGGKSVKIRLRKVPLPSCPSSDTASHPTMQ